MLTARVIGLLLTSVIKDSISDRLFSTSNNRISGTENIGCKARCVRRDDSFSKRTTFISAFKPASSSSINFVPKYATDMVKKAFSCLSSVNKSIGRYVKDVSDYFFQYQRIKRFPKVF